jgi:hypothetical protein
MSRKSTLALVATAVLGLAAITPTATSAHGLGGSGVVNFGRSAMLLGPRPGFGSFAPTAASARGLGGGIAHGNTVQATAPNVTIIGVLVGELEPAHTRARGQANFDGARAAQATRGSGGGGGSGGGLPANPKQPHPK